MKENYRVWCTKCQDCQEHQPKNNVTQFNMEQENVVHLEPMDRLGVDPFDIGPKAYLAIVDRSSSYVKCYLLRDKTFNLVRKALVDFFLMFGRAHKIRTDGGPCFLCQFRTWAFCWKHPVLEILPVMD